MLLPLFFHLWSEEHLQLWRAGKTSLSKTFIKIDFTIILLKWNEALRLMFDQSLINRCSDGLTPHIQMVYNNLYIWCLLEAYSLCMFCFVFFFIRLRGAEGARLQSREVCRLRGLRGFDCCGGHQPRCEDHPCWWRSPHHRGTRMLTHTYKLLLMLIFFLFYQMSLFELVLLADSAIWSICFYFSVILSAEKKRECHTE